MGTVVPVFIGSCPIFYGLLEVQKPLTALSNPKRPQKQNGYYRVTCCNSLFLLHQQLDQSILLNYCYCVIVILVLWSLRKLIAFQFLPKDLPQRCQHPPLGTEEPSTSPLLLSPARHGTVLSTEPLAFEEESLKFRLMVAQSHSQAVSCVVLHVFGSLVPRPVPKLDEFGYEALERGAFERLFKA